MSLLPHQARVGFVEYKHAELSLTRQTELLGLSRSSLYYQPTVNTQDQGAMNAIDEIYTKYPFYGSRRMQYELNVRHGIKICREHIQRLTRAMGLEAVYPKKNPHLSDPDGSHKKYPYLLKNVTSSFPNHIWDTDITYIRLEQGFCYLVALLDWYSRYIVAWTLSPTKAVTLPVLSIWIFSKLEIFKPAWTAEAGVWIISSPRDYGGQLKSLSN